MKRLPVVFWLALVVTWLLLNESVSPGHILLGMVFATLLLLASSRLRPLRPRIRKPWLLIKLGYHVFRDIIRSNVAVAAIVLGLVRDREIRSGFMEIPLDLTDPHGLAVLSMIITSTPGTVWVGLGVGGATLKLHILDLKDEEGWIRLVKGRYEKPLLEVFQCSN